ncbi:MAG: toll/interleukin-1 receptor domain-containing protein [Chloroflexi bacterium]|nr:toll/interleukin-1 receptor domain-containing protein [Chloroflexota bacterium]
MAQYLIRKDEYQYDVFLSHASEDKDDVARPLAVLLQERGLRVWYDEFELKIGDNLVAKLNAGISGSRFGILVLSKDFFGKDWTKYELDALENLAVTEDRILFPIWHNITGHEVRAYRASLANIVARSTATHNIEEIADEILAVIRIHYAD